MPKPELIVALDNLEPRAAEKMAETLAGAGVRWFKVGLELYTAEGPGFVERLKKRGYRVFLDLKLHDIPNTVAKAVGVAASLEIDLMTVHCSGGPPMLRAACEAAEGSRVSLLGVTVLTSLDGDEFAAIASAWGAPRAASVPRGSVALELARLACAAGLPGIVCSVSDLRDGALGKLPWRVPKPLFVTPGIRGTADAVGDQKSTGTVAQAIAAGSTHIVVGRPITASPTGDAASAAKRFLAELG